MADSVCSERIHSTQVSGFEGRGHSGFIETVCPCECATYGTQRELFHEQDKTCRY